MKESKTMIKANLFYFGGKFLVASAFGFIVFLFIEPFLEISYDSTNSSMFVLQMIAPSLGFFILFFLGVGLWIHGDVLREEN